MEDSSASLIRVRARLHHQTPVASLEFHDR